MAAGHVYRSPSFWFDFYYPDTIRNVFEGGRLPPDAPALRQMVAGFVIAVNDHCGSRMPPDAVRFTETEVTRIMNGFGIQVGGGTRTRNFRVHKELAAYFRAMVDKPPSASEITGLMGSVDDLVSGRIGREDASVRVAGNSFDAQRLVRSADCQSATTLQFFASLVANANATATPLESGIPIPGAMAETGLPPDPDRPAGLFDACMRMGGYNQISRAYCKCTDQAMVGVLSDAEMSEAIGDFERVAAAWFHDGDRAETNAGRTFQQCVAKTAR